ncbi:putative sterile alpha motif domain, JmjC domain, sterile alpha motif/pointed domain superfamily [Plasmopara halstedii]
MFTHQALATSPFANLSDELIVYFTLFFEPNDLLQLSEVNSVFYVFCQEDPLWMGQCLRLHNGDFSYHHNWKLTTFYPKDPRPLEQLEKVFRPVVIKGFSSDFLYRRWCRCHMELGDTFLIPSELQDPTIRKLQKIDIQDLTFKDFYEQYSRMPFIIRNAIGKWKASTEWTTQKMAQRFSDDIKHRITHNLDITSGSSKIEMTFADYFNYASKQNDETPLYIFDARFGEKMPTMLEDYNIEDLKVFKEDFLSVISSPKNEKLDAGMAETVKGVKLEAGGKKSRKHKILKRTAMSKRPDFRWIVIGPQRTGASWHQDPARTSAWNSLIKGRKRWAIYPPESPPPGVFVSKNGEYRESALDMPSLMWFLHIYPTLTPAEKPLEIIQEEGETIYVPNGWWHLVLNLDFSIAVTQNFVDSHNIMMFIKDRLFHGQDERLMMLQHKLRATRPEIFDLFRIAQIYRARGYMDEDMYQRSFHILEFWKPYLKRILKRYKALGQPSRTNDSTNSATKMKYSKMKSLTSRVNPTFAIGNRLLVKFFSQYNENWGEFDFETYMTPNFDFAESDIQASCKRRKQNSLQPHELKSTMSLRYAMEECFRIERAVYEMIEVLTSSNDEQDSLRTAIPRLYHSGHLFYLDEVEHGDEEGPVWRWPYVVIEYKSSSVSLKSIAKKGGATRSSWTTLASWIGRKLLPKLHAVPINSSFIGLYGHSKAEWGWYIHYLLRQRKRSVSFHLTETGLPAHLLNLLEKFLPAANKDAIVSELLPIRPSDVKPVLLHGDLTDENILGDVLDDAQSDIAMSTIENDACDRFSSLSSFLTSVGCQKYIPLLVEQEELTLESLGLLSEAHLKDLGVPLGPRLAILKGKIPVTTLARIEDDGSNDRPNIEEIWESSSSSSNSSDEDEVSDPTSVGPTSIEAKRKERYIGLINWTPTTVIDFADAKTGDPLFDLVAVFFAALHCDRELWKETLASEYWQNYIHRDTAASPLRRRRLRERFLQLVLLHPSRAVKSLFYYFPQAANLTSWEDIASDLFRDLF